MKVIKDIHELILAYLRDDISEEEMSHLREWLAESERHQRLLEELRDKDTLQREIGEYASFDTSRRWDQLEKVMGKPSGKRSSLLQVWGVVAASRSGGFRGGIGLLANGRFVTTGKRTSDDSSDRTRGNTGGIDYGERTASVITRIEGYLF